MMHEDLLHRMQDISYSILCRADDYMRAHDIPYFLSGGSCLGAVRHGGFIPWDDDVDIMMPRKVFVPFLKGFAAEYGEQYGVGQIDIDPKWTIPHARIWDKSTYLRHTRLMDSPTGIFIDIFPIDGLPDGKAAQARFYKRIHRLNILRKCAVRAVYKEHERDLFLKKYILDPAAHLVGPRPFLVQMDRTAQRYPFETSKQVAVCMADHYGDRETIGREAFASTVYLPFRDRKLPVPVGYKQYLSNLYGDYMKIPEHAAETAGTHLNHWEIRIPDDIEI